MKDLPFGKCSQDNISLPLQLIKTTVEERAVYLKVESPLKLSRVTPHLPLSASQQVALKLCLANSPLMVIQGFYGSGKTRIAQVLAQGLIEQEKRILILTQHPEATAAYSSLSISPFLLTLSQNYSIWLWEKLQETLDFLPIHLLPDNLLAQLRSPRKLEKWLFFLQHNPDLNKITSHLQTEFPNYSIARLNLLAYRLQKLLPLLQQQLCLHQQSELLSEKAVNTLVAQIEKESLIPIVGTVSDFFQANNQPFREKFFDCVIIDEAEYLSWEQLILIAGITHKLILLGNLPLYPIFPSRSSIYKYPPLFGLVEFLLPTYRYQLSEQFRLHSSLAKPIFKTLYDQWIHTQSRSDFITLPQLTARLQWKDVRAKPTQQENPWEGNRVFKFMSALGYALASQIGILAFTQAQRDWLRTHCPPDFREVLIGSFADWVSQERRIVLVSCVGYPSSLQAQESAIALTRASDYLIFFGDYQLWVTQSSPLQPLLEQQELQREREVSLL